MAVITPHTTRAPGTLLTAAIYNADHVNHVNNANNLNADKKGYPIVNADLADMVQGTIKLRPAGGGTGPPVDGTGAQAKAIIGDASATATGVVELATDAEVLTGTDTARAVTPANVTAKLASPGPIGGTAPGPGTFTAIIGTTGNFTGLLTLTNGQISFPVAQNASSDSNTLDDYEEGTWTPTLTFGTPGNLAVTYTIRSGRYVKIGRQVSLSFSILTATFTHTTAAGNCNVTALPFNPVNVAGGHAWAMSTAWTGINQPAAGGYSQIGMFVIANMTTIFVTAFGFAKAVAFITAADMPTGGTVEYDGSVSYEAAT